MGKPRKGFPLLLKRPAAAQSETNVKTGKALNKASVTNDDNTGKALKASETNDKTGKALNASETNDITGKALKASETKDNKGKALKASESDDKTEPITKKRKTIPKQVDVSSLGSSLSCDDYVDSDEYLQGLDLFGLHRRAAATSTAASTSSDSSAD